MNKVAPRAMRNDVWLTTQASWQRLHYVEADWPEEDFEAVAICGVEATFALPGVFSRLAMPRCAMCCRKLGARPGHGTLLNESGRSA